MYESLAHGLAFLKAHQAWAGPVLGLGAGFEAVVVIGAFTPLTPFLVMVGAAIAAGVFSPWILIWTMVGCGLGNWTSYEIGRRARLGDRAPTWMPARLREKAEALFRRYGPMAVIAGRFLGPTASVMPFMAGWSAMPRGRFLLANLATSLVWPVCMAAVGYLGARSASG